MIYIPKQKLHVIDKKNYEQKNRKYKININKMMEINKQKNRKDKHQ